MLAINVQQRRNQSAVIIRGKWLAVSGKIGCFASRDVRRIAVNHRVRAVPCNVRNRSTKIITKKERVSIPRLFSKQAHFCFWKIRRLIAAKWNIETAIPVGAIKPVKAVAVQV